MEEFREKTSSPPALRCWRCATSIGESDRYCRRCGNGQGRFLQWYYRPLWIAVLTVTTLGPFGLYLVWRTPRLERASRWIATLLIFLLTAYLVVQVSRIVEIVETLQAPP